MGSRILTFRPEDVAPADPPSSDPAVVYAYLRGLDAGDRHGYARGRAEGMRDLARGVLGYFTTPLWGSRR